MCKPTAGASGHCCLVVGRRGKEKDVFAASRSHTCTVSPREKKRKGGDRPSQHEGGKKKQEGGALTPAVPFP